MTIEEFVRKVRSGGIDVSQLDVIDDCGEWCVIQGDSSTGVEICSGSARDLLPTFFKLLGLTVIDAADWEG
jgi:hypothetical protein